MNQLVRDNQALVRVNQELLNQVNQAPQVVNPQVIINIPEEMVDEAVQREQQLLQLQEEQEDMNLGELFKEPRYWRRRLRLPKPRFFPNWNHSPTWWTRECLPADQHTVNVGRTREWLINNFAHMSPDLVQLPNYHGPARSIAGESDNTIISLTSIKEVLPVKPVPLIDGKPWPIKGVIREAGKYAIKPYYHRERRFYHSLNYKFQRTEANVWPGDEELYHYLRMYALFMPRTPLLAQSLKQRAIRWFDQLDRSDVTQEQITNTIAVVVTQVMMMTDEDHRLADIVNQNFLNLLNISNYIPVVYSMISTCATTLVKCTVGIAALKYIVK